jgi:hypothetical protein
LFVYFALNETKEHINLYSCALEGEITTKGFDNSKDKDSTGNVPAVQDRLKVI